MFHRQSKDAPSGGRTTYGLGRPRLRPWCRPPPWAGSAGGAAGDVATGPTVVGACVCSVARAPDAAVACVSPTLAAAAVVQLPELVRTTSTAATRLRQRLVHPRQWDPRRGQPTSTRLGQRRAGLDADRHHQLSPGQPGKADDGLDHSLPRQLLGQTGAEILHVGMVRGSGQPTMTPRARGTPMSNATNTTVAAIARSSPTRPSRPRSLPGGRRGLRFWELAYWWS